MNVFKDGTLRTTRDGLSVQLLLRFHSSWTLRAGLAYDEQAGEATLSIPDSDRMWYSAKPNVFCVRKYDFGCLCTQYTVKVVLLQKLML